jgi:hypothetical protein
LTEYAAASGLCGHVRYSGKRPLKVELLLASERR